MKKSLIATMLISIFLAACQPHLPLPPKTEKAIVAKPKIVKPIETQCQVGEPETFAPLNTAPKNAKILRTQVEGLIKGAHERWLKTPKGELVLLAELDGSSTWYVFKLYGNEWSWCNTLIAFSAY